VPAAPAAGCGAAAALPAGALAVVAGAPVPVPPDDGLVAAVVAFPAAPGPPAPVPAPVPAPPRPVAVSRQLGRYRLASAMKMSCDGRNRVAAFGTRTTSVFFATSIVTFAVMPGFSLSSGFGTSMTVP